MASFKRNTLRAFLLFVAIFLVVYLVRLTDARHLLRVAPDRLNRIAAGFALRCWAEPTARGRSRSGAWTERLQRDRLHP